MRGKFYNISLISIHCPTEMKDDDVKDNFYFELERIVSKLPRYDMKILLGDFNSKIGQERALQPYIEFESPHLVSNDNGVHLANFAANINMRGGVSIP